VYPEVKSFQERNLVTIGGVGIAIVVGMVGASLQYDKLPFFSSGTEYSAYFAEVGGLTTDSNVLVSGYEVGRVDRIELDGTRVLVNFKITSDVRIGDRSEAAIKLKSALGSKVLVVTPRGDGHQSGPIPLDRTTPAYQLPDAIGDLTTAISGLDTQQLSQSLKVLSETFADTPPDVRSAIDGVARFSDTLNQRDGQLRSLLTNANKATTVLADRSNQVVSLVRDTNALLVQLQTQSAALDQISSSISAVSQQLKGFISENRTELKPALDKLNGVLAIVVNHRDDVAKALKGLNQYALGLGESVGSGPFFKAYLVNLLPGQFVQPFIDAAFSDLGVDPHVLLPTQLTDPQVGQPGTPPLPPPFPRTGQGGDPAMTLPGAITGNPGDPRYPYREPLPAPPPGGPPPGPPAAAPPGLESAPVVPQPLLIPAPGEPAAPTSSPVEAGQ
jgi:phospholipid/cholesterol/gamma-HCH transport system substrate-binding protein